MTPDEEREELQALLDADFQGLPHTALVATIHYLARRALERLDQQ